MLSTCCRSTSVCRMVHPRSVAHENGTSSPSLKKTRLAERTLHHSETLLEHCRHVSARDGHRVCRPCFPEHVSVNKFPARLSSSILCSSEFVVLQNVSAQSLEDQLRKALLNPVPGEMSEDLHEYHHYLRIWGVRDLFESPLLDSVLDHAGTSTNCSTISVARNLLHSTLVMNVSDIKPEDNF